MNTRIFSIAFIFSLFLLFSSNLLASDKSRHHKSNHGIFTFMKLTNRQFERGYHAEREDHKNHNKTISRKMQRKQKGGRFYRWYHRNF